MPSVISCKSYALWCKKTRGPLATWQGHMAAPMTKTQTKRKPFTNSGVWRPGQISRPHRSLQYPSFVPWPGHTKMVLLGWPQQSVLYWLAGPTVLSSCFGNGHPSKYFRFFLPQAKKWVRQANNGAKSLLVKCGVKGYGRNKPCSAYLGQRKKEKKKG